MADLDSGTIAETIIQYEKAKHSFAQRAAETLVTGVPHPDLSWALHMKLGVVPEGHPKSPYPHKEGHPLTIAAAFVEDASVREQLLDIVRRDIEYAKRDQSAYAGISAGDRGNTDALPVPPPPAAELRLRDGFHTLFRPQHAAWYEPKVVREMTRNAAIRLPAYHLESFLEESKITLAEAGLSSASLHPFVLNALQKELARRPAGNIPYGRLALLAQSCEPGAALSLLERSSTAYKSLGVVVPETQEKAMVTGLKVLAKLTSDARHAILARISRAPTLKELQEANVVGFHAVLDKMPWPIMEALVQEHGAKLRGLLLPHMKRVPVQDLECCFSNHDRRAPHKPIPTAGAHIDRSEWEVYAAGLQRYYPARELRKRLQGYPEPTQQLLVLWSLTRDPKFLPYVEAYASPEVREALENYKSPLRRARFGTGFEEGEALEERS